MLILFIWPLIGSRVPAPVIVVLVGIVFAWHFDLAQKPAINGSNYLIAIPDNFLAGFYFPDFSKLFTIAFWEAVFAISLVGSIESLLVATAVDKLDPYKRTSDLDRDLTAVGIGNMAAGFIGGLPMIAEIIRSSENVNNGAKTAWANFFHGLLLLMFVVLFPGLIQRIPLASLAALLVYTGYRLASPKTFLNVLDVGKDQLFMFVITIIGVLATDLLIGVTLGVITKLVIDLVRGVWLNNLFKIHFTIKQQDNATMSATLERQPWEMLLAGSASESLRFTLPMVSRPPAITDVSGVVSEVAPLLAAPITLRLYDPIRDERMTWTAEPTDMGQWLTFRPRSPTRRSRSHGRWLRTG